MAGPASAGVPAGAIAAARHMCRRSGWSLTNLSLQKMLYISQMMYLGENHARLFNGRFEAWNFGPVEPTVYHRVKAFGDEPIRNIFHLIPDVSDASRAEALDDAYDQMANMSPGRLVSITHWKEGAWAKNYVPGLKGVVIPDEDILEEFDKRASLSKG